MSGQPFQFDAQQARIHRRLLLIGQGPAAFYKDACRLMAGTPFPTLTHFVGHALREIESALRDVLEPVTKEGTKAAARKQGGNDKHREEIRTILIGLEIPETDPAAEAWLNLPGKENAYGLHARAHRIALAMPRPLDGEFHQFWITFNRVLDVVLDRFEARYLTSHRLIDELLKEQHPTKGHADRLRNRLPNNLVSFEYFFSKLASPAWLEPLHEAGLFTYAPAPEHNEEAGTIRYPLWPQSRYLARMAALPEPAVKDTVSRIGQGIDDQGNASIQDDLLAIALALPAAQAAAFTSRAQTWIDAPLPSVADKLAAFIVHLTQGNHLQEAFSLATAVFAVNEVDGRANEDYRSWMYNKALQNVLPALIAADAGRTLLWLLDLLDTLLHRELGAEHKGDDGSAHWRPTIAEHQHQRDDNIRNILVTAVRNTARELVQNDPTRLSTVLTQLEQRDWGICRRISLHLLTQPDAPHDLVAPRALNLQYFHSDTVRYEYTSLLHIHAQSLTPAELQILLDAIEQGPQYIDLARANHQFTGKDLSAAEERQLIKHWQRDRLGPLKAALTGNWKERYVGLVQEFGEPPDRDEHLYPIARSWGPTSPKRQDELHALAPGDLITFLRTWEAPINEGFFTSTPSAEGLADALRTLVGTHPDTYAPHAGDFIGLNVMYVHAFLMGMEGAARAHRTFAWEPVLRLVQWVLTQTDPATHDRPAHGQPWAEVRATAIGLVHAGLVEGGAEIPLTYRATVWDVLERFARDHDPSPERDAQATKPSILSINAVRSRALFACIAYGVWVRRHTPVQRNTFDDLPELRTELEHQLDLAIDSSLAVRSVYGERLLTLFYLDAAWTKASGERIFPSDLAQRTYRDAAWEAYLTSTPPYRDLMLLLKLLYEEAVLALTPDDAEEPTSVQLRLGEHLLLAYLSGISPWSDDYLLTDVYTHASAGLRVHLTQLAGQTAGNPYLANDWHQRLTQLWDNRLAAARAHPVQHAKEIQQFGYWFSNDAFDATWALQALGDALTVVGTVTPDFAVIKRLADLAAAHPAAVVARLEQLLLVDLEPWAIPFWAEDLRRALRGALLSADGRAQAAARQLIHRLAARGHLEFSDLLQ